MHRFFIVAGLLLVLVACGQTPAVNDAPTAVPTAPPTVIPTPFPATALPNQLYVNVDIARGRINPLVYGTNYGPWTAVPANMLGEYQSSGLTMLRFPGGNWGDENTVRPNQVDFLMDMARMVDAEIVLHVNLLGGTPEQALDMMRLVNEDRGYGVKYWSIGNEPNLYAPSRGFTEWDTVYFNQRWREFAEAMKAADPEILLIGPDLSQYTAVDANNPKDANGRDWMREFLRANGDLVDMVAIHRYPFPASGTNPNPTIEELRQNSPEWDAIIPHLRQVIQDEVGRDLPVAVMEVNSNWSNTLGGEATPDSFYNAIWWADSLGRMIQQDVDMVAYFVIAHSRGGAGLLALSAPNPTFYVYKMYQQFGAEKLHASSGTADVSIFAARRDDGAVTLMMVNRGPDEVAVPLQVDGYAGSSAELWRFDAEHNAENLGVVDWANGETITLPGQSISLLVLSP